MLFRRAVVSNLTKFCIFKYIHPSLEILQPFYTRRISSFVEYIRKQQTLKESKRIPDICYEDGDFIFFSRNPKKVLVYTNKLPNGSKKLQLHRQSYKVVTDLGLNAMKDSVFLSVSSNSKCQFAVEVSSSNGITDRIENASDGKFIGVRSSLFLLSAEDSSVTSQGISLLSWHKRNVYCSNCGNLLINDGFSYSKVCGSESCINSKGGNRHHPSINPVGICLVSNESQSKTLLVRKANHPPGMFTCIAGFIEVGEGVEDNIKREVAEEVGMEALKVDYVASQHWAFPASRLMIGCHATVMDSEENISIDKAELEDAAWFTPKQIKESLQRVKEISLKGKGVSSLWNIKDSSSSFHWVPPRGALANTLVQWWLKKFHPEV